MARVPVAAHKKQRSSAIKSPGIAGDKASGESVATAKKPQQMRGKSHRTPVASKIDPAANIDTRSDVSVAASQECHRSATDSATNSPLIPAENVWNSRSLREVGRGDVDQRGGPESESEPASRGGRGSSRGAGGPSRDRWSPVEFYGQMAL
jgi:hypothetical protein